MDFIEPLRLYVASQTLEQLAPAAGIGTVIQACE